jgi:hypothetical protein
MKIKFTHTFEVDPKEYPNLSASKIRDEFISTATSYMQHIEEETRNYLADENVIEKRN